MWLVRVFTRWLGFCTRYLAGRFQYSFFSSLQHRARLPLGLVSFSFEAHVRNGAPRSWTQLRILRRLRHTIIRNGCAAKTESRRWSGIGFGQESGGVAVASPPVPSPANRDMFGGL